MSDWQPIETAPKDGTPIIGWFPAGHSENVMIAKFKAGRKPAEWIFKNHSAWGYAVKGAPTHWMPLPPPPCA